MKNNKEDPKDATTLDQKKAGAETEEEQKAMELLKKDNDELGAQFKDNMQRTEEQKLQQIQDTFAKN